MTRSITTSPKRKLRALGTWLTVFALMVQTFLPLGTALALETESNADSVILCTANGMQTITLDADGTPQKTETQISCPFCVLHAAALGVEAHNQVSEAICFAETTSAWFPANHNPATIWRAVPSPSRAPPLLFV